ncbi:MAG: DUF4317 domain-containing protein [Oscillospiraceae bacterium]|nr:DUF4317 domain-containing protein [Oscillospiraceae bacterium]
MNKKDINEIRRQFTPDNCTITRLCGCYVDNEKNKKTEIREAFLSLPEEEIFKYFDIFRKTLSGTIGRNLLNMEFPLDSEFTGGTQEFLLRLRDSQLQEPALLEAFYDKIISSYEYGENYLILLIHAAYDIPGKASDDMEMFDASDEVYEYILCSICPVNLSKPALSYNVQDNCFQDRIRDWIVEMPSLGFLFPAFQDRSTDLHSLLYYSKNTEQLNFTLIDQVLGCAQPISAGEQREVFQTLIEDTLGDTCAYEVVRNIHDNLSEMMEEHKDEPEPLMLDRDEVKYLFAKSGVEEAKLQEFDRQYEKTAGEDTMLMASNVVNTRRFEIKTPDIVIQVNPERTDLVESRIIDGRQCLVIAVDDRVEINGISARTMLPGKPSPVQETDSGTADTEDFSE